VRFILSPHFLLADTHYFPLLFLLSLLLYRRRRDSAGGGGGRNRRWRPQFLPEACVGWLWGRTVERNRRCRGSSRAPSSLASPVERNRRCGDGGRHLWRRGSGRARGSSRAPSSLASPVELNRRCGDGGRHGASGGAEVAGAGGPHARPPPWRRRSRVPPAYGAFSAVDGGSALYPPMPAAVVVRRRTYVQVVGGSVLCNDLKKHGSVT
jgi:hypothetical protein